MLGIRIALVVASVLLIASTASAHTAGSPPITESGSIQLSPMGKNNSTYHAYIVNLGIPPGPGDTLRFSWSSNAGLGPAVYFEIHAHPNTTGFVLYYRADAIRVDDSWAVPGPEDYMVFWDNRNDAPVNVTYTFQLIAPTDLTPLLAFPAMLAGLLVAIWVDRRRRGRTDRAPDAPEGIKPREEESPRDRSDDPPVPPPR